jgi:hypothetical protein
MDTTIQVGATTHSRVFFAFLSSLFSLSSDSRAKKHCKHELPNYFLSDYSLPHSLPKHRALVTNLRPNHVLLSSRRKLEGGTTLVQTVGVDRTERTDTTYCFDMVYYICLRL